MLKFVKISLYFLLLTLTLIITGCNSGEYDIEQYQVTYTEKTLKVDSLRKITINDGIKEDKKDPQKDSYTYTIQIGAFSQEDNMQKFFDQAKIALSELTGEDVYLVQTSSLMKIRIGTYYNRADASKRIDFIRSKGYNDAFVVTTKKLEIENQIIIHSAAHYLVLGITPLAGRYTDS